MQCPFCKEDIQEGVVKCAHCGSMIAKVETSVPAEQQAAAQKPWWKYIPFTDKSIKTIDKVLMPLYGMSAWFFPISAVVSLLVLHLVRKKYVHSLYLKSASINIIGTAIMSFAITMIKKLA